MTATRRPLHGYAEVPSLAVDQVEGLADGLDALELVLLDGDVELVLEGHHELGEVEAVGVEVVGEAGLLGDLVGLDGQHLHGEGLEPLEGVAHRVISLLVW